MSDQFESVRERHKFDDFDRYGRYRLPDKDGKMMSWTRATTFAKSISDTFNLSQWSQRMVAKGLTIRSDLLALAWDLDVKADRDKFNKLCEDAKAAAGDKVAANMGTALHSFSEAVDSGMSIDTVPEAHRDDVRSYVTAMRTAGLQVVPGMIERQVALPAYEVAGSLDRILSLDEIEPWFREALHNAGYGRPGTAFLDQESEVIGDVKSGQDLQYGWNEIAIQLAIYATAARTYGIWNNVTKSWEPARPVRQDFAIVMHMPVGQKTTTLYALDLHDAMRALDLCRDVRQWRKMRNLARPLERAVVGDEPPPEVTGLSWLERFQLAGSRGELSALFNEAVAAGVWSDALKQAGTDRLRVLEDKAG